MRLTRATLPWLPLLRGFGLNRHVRGWNRLLGRLFPHHAQPACPLATRQWGLPYLANPSHYIDWNVLCYGSYEASDLALFRKLVGTREALCLDIGANVGHHTLFFGSLGWRVLAFEPNPTLWPEFEAKVAASGLRGISLHRIGLADEDGELAFELEHAANSGTGRYVTGLPSTSADGRPVGTLPIRRGDAYLEQAGVPSVDVIKMDIQGFEPEALAGLRATIERCRPLVSLEIAPDNIAKFGSLAGLVQHLPEGYRFLRAHRVQAGPFRWTRAKSCTAEAFATMDGNLFCVPNDRPRRRPGGDA